MGFIIALSNTWILPGRKVAAQKVNICFNIWLAQMWNSLHWEKTAGKQRKQLNILIVKFNLQNRAHQHQ